VFKAYAGGQAGLGAAGARPAAAVAAGPGGWQPTVLYMLGLVIGEILAVAWLTRHLLGD